MYYVIELSGVQQNERLSAGGGKQSRLTVSLLQIIALTFIIFAKTIPHVFLFNNKWELVYEGAIDDNHKNADLAKNHYLENALKNLEKGKKIDPENTKAMGCSIKRVKS